MDISRLIQEDAPNEIKHLCKEFVKFKIESETESLMKENPVCIQYIQNIILI